MPRAAVEDNRRMNLRVTPEAKAKLVRAAAIRQTGLTHFITQSALREAEAVIQEAEVIEVSQRGYGRILELLEAPPPPNERLRAAIAALPPTI